ncbi:hypothetical protein A9F13_24g00880 [Clavispora lusitaniae]|uniref:Uncharacterized protein n=1 Tax=Clavispora lusitaniae TaxID=36911 RepID=A0AA91PWF7_CLALS|nr:hypothetical protein A9F13_24g00880 [Clavispora lusitaniae]
MSTPIVNTEGTRSSSSSSDSFGSVIDSTARNMRVHRADAIALSASQRHNSYRHEGPLESPDSR